MTAPINIKITKIIGSNIKLARECQGITQHELSKSTNISISTISNFERGLRLPSLDMLLKLKDTLGIKLNDFIDGA